MIEWIYEISQCFQTGHSNLKQKLGVMFGSAVVEAACHPAAASFLDQTVTRPFVDSCASKFLKKEIAFC